MLPVLLAVSVSIGGQVPQSCPDLPKPGEPIRQKQQSVVLGLLGQTTISAQIFESADIGSRALHEAKAGEYLVLAKGPNSDWWKVLLENGSYGYIQANSVTNHPYEVVAKAGYDNKKQSVAKLALAMVGKELENGLDSGALVQKLYAKVGLDLPRSLEAQSQVGRAVTRLEDLKGGDRLYFRGPKSERIDQTGIYVGNGYFVTRNQATGKIETIYLAEKKWLASLVASRR